MNIEVFKKRLTWAIDKWLPLTINAMLFKSVIRTTNNQKNKAVFNLKTILYALLCDP